MSSQLIQNAIESNQRKEADYIDAIVVAKSDNLPTFYSGHDPNTGQAIIERLGQGEIATAQQVSNGGISSGQAVQSRGEGSATKIQTVAPTPLLKVVEPKILEVAFYFFLQVTGGDQPDFIVSSADYSSYADLLDKGKIPKYNQSLNKSGFGVILEVTTRNNSADIKQHEFRVKITISRTVSVPSPLALRSQIECWSNRKKIRVSREVINFNQVGFNGTITNLTAVGGNPADRTQEGTQNSSNGLWQSEFTSLSLDNAVVGVQNYYLEQVIRSSQEFPAETIIYP